MRRLPIVALALVALAGPGCGGEDEAQVVRGDGYEYELPDGWEHRSDPEFLEDVTFAGFSPDTIVTADPDEGFADNVNVIVEHSVAPSVTAREYVDASVNVLRNPELLRGEPGRQIAGLNARDFAGPTRVELDGTQAYATEYTGDQGGRELRFRNVVAVRDGTAYGITYTALRHRFRENAGAANGVFDTWTWR